MFRFITPCLILVLGLSACKDRGNPIIPEEHFEAGPILFVSDKSGTSQLYSMNEDGSDVKQLTHDPNFPITDARWSPDGSKIAIESPVGGVDLYGGAIYVMNADGTGRYLLTQQTADLNDSTYGNITYAGAIHPVWSPDSKRIAYARLMVPEAIANWDIFAINVTGTNERRITGTIGLAEGVYDWSKNGESLWGVTLDYSARDSSGRGIQYTKLTLFNLEGIVLSSWGNPGESWGWPISSQSGNKIAFILSDTHYRFDIYIMNSGNTERVNLTNGIYQYPQPVSWSPDDIGILLNVSNRNNEGRLIYRILIVNSDGSNANDITPFPNNDETRTYATSWRRR